MLRMSLIVLILLFALSPLCLAANGGVGGARKADNGETVIVNEPAQDALIRVFGDVELKPLKVDGVFVAQPIKAQGAVDPPPGGGDGEGNHGQTDEETTELSLSYTGLDYSAQSAAAYVPPSLSTFSAGSPNPEPSGALALGGGLAGVVGFALRRRIR